MNSKKKIASVSEPLTSVRNKVLEAGGYSEAAGPERLDLSDWHSVVAELEHQEFQSFEQAVDVVVDKLLQRMQLTISESQELELFLRDLFDIDPIAAADLRSSLKIKS